MRTAAAGGPKMNATIKQTKIETPNLSALLSSLKDARRSHADLQKQLASVSADAERHEGEVARARDEVERQFRAAGESGGKVPDQFSEEVRVAKLERQQRVLNARVTVCLEKLSASHASIEALRARIAAEASAFAVQGCQHVVETITEAALILQASICQLEAFTAAFPDLVHTCSIGGSLALWRLVGSHSGERYNPASVSHTGLRDSCGVHTGPIAKWLVPHDVLMEGGAPLVLVAGAGDHLQVGVRSDFFGGEKWKAIGGAGPLHEQLAMFCAEINAAIGTAEPSPAVKRPPAASVHPPVPAKMDAQQEFLMNQLDRAQSKD
jgi:hypothetical protein